MTVINNNKRALRLHGGIFTSHKMPTLRWPLKYLLPLKYMHYNVFN